MRFVSQTETQFQVQVLVSRLRRTQLLRERYIDMDVHGRGSLSCLLACLDGCLIGLVAGWLPLLADRPHLWQLAAVAPAAAAAAARCYFHFWVTDPCHMCVENSILL